MLNANRKTLPGSRSARRKASAAAQPHLHTNPLAQALRTLAQVLLLCLASQPSARSNGILHITTLTVRNQRRSAVFFYVYSAPDWQNEPPCLFSASDE